MSAVDFQKISDRIRAVWPDSRNWNRDLEVLFGQFRDVPADALDHAVTEYFDAGHDRAPNPSTLKASAIRLARQLPDDPAHCPHRIYAVDDLGNGYREATCANPACRHVWQARAEILPTVGERAST